LRHSVIRFRDDVEHSYPLQALLVTSVLNELELADHHAAEVSEKC
jgi:hypothetical protein